MSAVKNELFRLVDGIPDEMLPYLINYAEFIKSKNYKEIEHINNGANSKGLLSLFDTLGAWEDSKDADAIIQEIEGSRTSRKADIVL